MSRVMKEDFEELLKFITDFSLKSIITDKEAKETISACHKCYYAYLVLISELKLTIGEKKYSCIITENQYNFLKESCSDMGQAFFLMINGCYKGARMLLRSSIENFIKAISLDEIKDIDKNKSVYDIFDKSKEILIYKDNVALWDMIHDQYKELCKDVHTSDLNHMANITALNYFPTFEKKQAVEIYKFIHNLSQAYVSSLAIKYNQQYHQINYLNKNVTNSLIIKDMKKKVFNF